MGWTPDQEKAIYTDTGTGNLLVSAAAGSGKTAVLVERVLQKILSGKSTIDRLLIVTFTEAAASEMKQKIIKRLNEYMKSDECTQNLKPLIKSQIRLTQTADILTIDGFCNRIVLNNFHMLGIDPNFSICDNAMAEMMIAEAMSNVFDNIYKSDDIEIKSRFRRLTECYAKDRSNDRLAAAIVSIYRFTESFPDPIAWLNDAVLNFDRPIDEQSATRFRLEYSKRTAYHAICELQNAPTNDAPTNECIDFVLNIATAIYEAEDWDAVYDIYAEFFDKPKKRETFMSLANPLLPSPARDALLFATHLLADIFTKSNNEKTAMGVIFSRDEMIKNDNSRLYKEEAEDIVWIVSLFIRELEKIKDKRNMYEFSDIEHLTYKLFRDNDIIRCQYTDKYDEILIDEYQDTNMLQDTVFELISHNNIFMVGDLKQSIYRFRKGDPYIFKTKSETYESPDTQHQKIILSQNFRSRQEVLKSVNDVFSKIMSEHAGDVDYSERECIVRDDEYEYYPAPDTNLKSELHYIGITKEAGMDKELCEVRYTAQKIKELLESNTKIFDKDTGGLRKIQKRDIVILENSLKYNAHIITDELSRLGIDSYVEKSTFFGRREITVMTALLSVINNTHDDIPLITVMRSPIGGFSDNDLAMIRINAKDSIYFIDAVKAYAKSGVDENLSRKCYIFTKNITRWRDYTRKKTVAWLIWSIYEETCFYDMMGAIEESDEAQSNLRLLYERAKQFENAGFKGLLNFIKYINRLEESSKDSDGAKLVGENHDVVRIMTIHKSKGLEFPYVFLLGMGHQFTNKADVSRIRMHKTLGLGMPDIHYDERYWQKNHIFDLVSRVNKQESVSERMRLLYVAMTRPREKLYIVMARPSKDDTTPEDIKDSWENVLTGKKMLPSDALSAKGFFSWICPGAYASPESWDVYVSVLHSELTIEECNDTCDSENYCDSAELRESVYKLLDYKYPYCDSHTVPTRTSVTQLKEMENTEYEPDSRRVSGIDDTAELLFSPLHSKPAFMLDESEKPANEIGTLYHLVMSKIDLGKVQTDGVDTQLQQLINERIITEDDVVYIDPDKIKSFFDSPLAKRMMMSSNIYRETPFQMNIPALMYDPTLTDVKDSDTVILQGIIDCFFEEDDGFVLFDYKTDKVKGNPQEIKDRYQKQLELYAKAITELKGKPVKESYLYLFDTGEVI